jgi:predicted RNA-binding Zn-ribbon protein involved in translation (DUF1610 family)
MTIRACRECNKDISTEARTCPNCGISDPIYRSAELIEAGKTLHQDFVILVVINIIGNLLLNWLDSGFFYWVIIILIICFTVLFSVGIIDNAEKYKKLASYNGNRDTLATIYKTIVIIYLLAGAGNLAYGLIH